MEPRQAGLQSRRMREKMTCEWQHPSTWARKLFPISMNPPNAGAELQHRCKGNLKFRITPSSTCSLLPPASALCSVLRNTLYPINTPLSCPPAVTLSSDHSMAAFNSIIPRHYLHIRLQGFDPKLVEVNEGSLNFELSPNCSANTEWSGTVRVRWDDRGCSKLEGEILNADGDKGRQCVRKQPWERMMIVLHSLSSRTDLCLYK